MASFLSTLFGGGAEKEAADKNRELYNTYQTQGAGYLDSGYQTARGDLNNALGSYAPLSALGGKYGGASSMLLNALGVNGASGNAAAQSAFTNNPGYTSGLDAGLDAINRRRAAAGMLGSGNADQDAQTFGQNLQNQQYNTWLSSLGSFVNPELAATSGAATGQAGVYGGMGTLATNNAQNQVGLLGNTTSGLTSANNLQAQGESAGAKNLLGLGTSLLSLGTGGGATVGSSLLSGLAAFSDRRLKSDVERIGTTKHGLPLYEYTIFGERQRGVMADEVEKVLPDAVLMHPSGYKMVNYRMLGLR